MTKEKTSALGWVWQVSLTILVTCLLISPASLVAQQGMNAITTSSAPVASAAFVDATQFVSGSNDFCQVIASILGTSFNTNNSNGIVVDARGFTGTLACSVNPFGNILSTSSFSNTVLLPANTIPIQTKWILANNTRLIGEGSGMTVITPSSSGYSGDMIDMGSQTACGSLPGDCTGIVIAHLGLNGGSVANVNGIVNVFGEELSSIDDVALTNFGTGSTGLILQTSSDQNWAGDANNSGPYTNIYYQGSGTCVNLKSVSTRGIHGITCVVNNSSTGAAIILDGPNNRETLIRPAER
jgi:hypothetical protein